MAVSTYRAITLMEVGQSAKEANVNSAYDNLSRGISGIVSVAVTSADVTLSDADENDQAKNLILNLTGASTGARNIIVPTTARFYIVWNATTGGFTHVVKTLAGTGISVAPGIKTVVFCDGTNVEQISGTAGAYTDEQAQDSVGAMVDASLVYVDATPLLTRAALTGDVTASQGSNATTIANDAVTFAKMQNISAASKLLGRGSAGGAGDTEEITLGTNLSMSGTTLNAASTSTQGRHTLWVPASAMTPATTNGAVENQLEMATNKNNRRVLSFADGSQLFAHLDIRFPKAWDEGTVTFDVVWTLNSTSTNSAVFGLQAVAMSDSDALDIAFGTAQEVTDAGLGTAYDLHISAESSALTIAGTPAIGDVVEFRFYRDPTDGADTLAVTVDVLGINIYFTTNADTDA